MGALAVGEMRIADDVMTVWTGTRWAAMADLLVPAGTISATAAVAADTGWLLCQGQTVVNAATLYPSLFARVPAGWISSTSIVLPDMRGRTIIGAGTGSGLTARTLGTAISNEESHTLLAGESGMPAHNTSNDAGDHAHGFSGTTSGFSNNHVHFAYPNAGTTGLLQNGGGDLGGASLSVGGASYALNTTTGAANADHTHTYSGNTGGRSAFHQHPVSAVNAVSAHNNMQPSYVLNYQIKAH